MEFKQGDRVRIEKNGTAYEGKVMPSMEGYITIKMNSGYNAGFSTDKVKITLLGNNGEITNGGRNGGKESKAAGETRYRSLEKSFQRSRFFPQAERLPAKSTTGQVQ